MMPQVAAMSKHDGKRNLEYLENRESGKERTNERPNQRAYLPTSQAANQPTRVRFAAGTNRLRSELVRPLSPACSFSPCPSGDMGLFNEHHPPRAIGPRGTLIVCAKRLLQAVLKGLLRSATSSVHFQKTAMMVRIVSNIFRIRCFRERLLPDLLGCNLVRGNRLRFRSDTSLTESGGHGVRRWRHSGDPERAHLYEVLFTKHPY